jgi:hypothetical protein
MYNGASSTTLILIKHYTNVTFINLCISKYLSLYKLAYKNNGDEMMYAMIDNY